MAHYYYCPFWNCNDKAIKNTEYRYAVKYGDPAFAHYTHEIYTPKEQDRHDNVVIQTNIRWDTVAVENGTKRRPAYLVPDATPLAKLRTDDTLIINGHGGKGSESIYTSEACDAEAISSKELALQLAMDGLQRDHVYIKIAACYSGGSFDGDKPHALARALAIALGFIRWNPDTRRHDTKMKTGAYRKIKVGGFQGKLITSGQALTILGTGQVLGYKVLPKPVAKPGSGPGQKPVTMPAKHKLVYFDADGNMCHKVEVHPSALSPTTTTYATSPVKTPVKKPATKLPTQTPAPIAAPHAPPPKPKGKVAALASRFESKK